MNQSLSTGNSESIVDHKRVTPEIEESRSNISLQTESSLQASANKSTINMDNNHLAILAENETDEERKSRESRDSRTAYQRNQRQYGQLRFR